MFRKLSFFMISVILLSSIFVPPAFAEAQAMDNTSGDYQYIVNGDNTSVTITKYTGTGTAVTLDKITNGSTTYNVTAIGNNAFKSKTAITSITLPDSLISIGASAFQGCTKLSSISLPANLENLGEYAFNSCMVLATVTIAPGSKLQSIPSNAFSFSGLQTFSVPEGVKSIGDSAFQNCSSLGTVSLPSTLTSLGTAVFKNCSSLDSVNIPSGIVSIPDYTFNGCSALESITLQSGVKTIGNFGFSSSGLKNIDLPDGITDIGENAFSFCASLASVGLPTGISVIKIDTFLNCTKLGSVTIPNGVQNIQDFAFGGCDSLKTVNISMASSGLKNIGESAFTSCISLESISIPGGVSAISDKAFYNCGSLNSVNLSEGLTTVGISAFEQCGSLESVILPVSLNAIGDDAFNGCGLLRAAYFKGSAPSATNFGANVFDGSANGFAVYYISTSTGFSNPFHGYEARTYDPNVNYTVSFDLNGKTGTTPDSQTVHENVKIKQPADPGCTGYSVEGWYTDKTVGTKWNFGSDGLMDNITLYAHWTPIQYAITYDLGGGSVTGNPNKYTIEDENITLNQPTRTGYTFIGWTGTGLSGNTLNVTIPKGSHEIRSYTANWQAHSNIVNFYSDGDCKYNYSADYDSHIIDPGLTKDGYQVEGWYTDNGTFLHRWNLQTDTMPDNAVNLYAHWTPVHYVITYNLGGGSASGNPNTYTIEDDNISLNHPIRTGYTFDGWTSADLSSKTMDVTIPKGSFGVRTYTANWKVNTYTVKFYSDGECKGSNPADYGSKITPPDVRKNNYELEGWYLDDGTFLHKWSIQTDTIPDKDISLYAHWTGVKITVSFNPGAGAKVAPSSMQAAYSESYGNLPIPTKSGYYFYGWYTGTNGTGVIINSGDTVNTAQNITLYAKWAKNSTVPIGKTSVTVKVKDYKTLALTWKAAKNAQGYEIYRSDGNASHFNLITTIRGSLIYIDTGLNSNIKYYYKVRAYRMPYITKVTSDSPVKSAKPVWPSINLKASARSYKSVALSWNPVNGARGYYVYRSMSKNGFYTQIDKVRGSASYTDSSLSASGTYYYKIAAFDDSVISDNPPSSALCKYKSAKTVCPKITLTVSSYGYDSISLKWNAINGVAGYYLYRSETQNGYYEQIADTANTVYIDTGRDSGKTYYYKVRAYDGTWSSQYSSNKSAKTIPSVPS